MEWKIAYVENCKFRELTSIKELCEAGLTIIPAEVPGNFELDLQREGISEDLYFSDNVYAAQKLENLHVFYFAEFDIKNKNEYLRFGGIDTLADIYVNGERVKTVDNMYLGYDVPANYNIGKNEVVVHIKSVAIEARKETVSAVGFTHDCGYASLTVRKAPHSYGWDIMPRILTSGLYKPVTIEEKKAEAINEVFIYTNSINPDGSASLQCYVNVDVSGDFIRDYRVIVTGKCAGGGFEKSCRLWHNTQQFEIYVPDAKLWNVKNYGEQNLYDVRVELLYKDKVIDTYAGRTGIRTVKLVRTDVTDSDGNGKFRFEVNGKRIFVMGTNWVPLDAMHSRDIKRLPEALRLLEDIGCNFVRCWGGNVYENDEFFDFCDEKGILIWQDFAMACAVYPQNAEFAEKLRTEAVYEIKRLRNHPSLALWAGDNECDNVVMRWDDKNKRRDPNMNILTRGVLNRAVFEHDPSRDFLPSSPYVSPEYIRSGDDGVLPENHMWGPRDWFKSDFYNNTFCHFASEIGYHGFNSPESLRKFLKNPEKIFEEDGFPTREYAAHATACDASEDSRTALYSDRIRLAHNQVEALFDQRREDLEEFACQSQISQAEAKKYFIEKFRTDKKRRSGIIWWNLIDGWPQISDAVVDWYYVKKLAYHYIKRSQEPLCFMFDEPQNGKIALVAVNDYLEGKQVKYVVTDVTNDAVLSRKTAYVEADGILRLEKFDVAKDEHTMYLVEWETDGIKRKNHYYTNLKNVSFEAYMKDLQKCGLDEREGF